jgi:outer membrane protein, multidrug efflux system
MRKALPLTLMLLVGCSMTPKYVQPASPVPVSWPTGDAYLVQSEAALPGLTYRDVVRDPRLLQLIESALANNRDLRIAAANIAAARASYRVQRADRLPTVATGASASQTGGSGAANSGSSFGADLGITAFEIDLFGRVAALTEAEQQRYFATEAAARSTRIALIGDVANAWISHAANAALLSIAEDTVRNAERSVQLTQARLEGGIAPRTDVRQAEQILANAEADVAAQRTAVAQDVNALRLLLGTSVEPALLPSTVNEADAALATIEPGLSSDILLRRPDVVQAEYELRAANAEIGAARAAMFPRISLTGVLGLASNALSGLFSGGAFSYAAVGDASYPIFSGGAARAGVAQREAQRDAALAAYERAIQSAFREVSDALAREGTIADELRANQRLVDAATDTARLTDARYRGGVASFLESLDAQRSLYAAQRTLVATRRIRAANLATLYRALATDEGPR